MQYLLNLTRTTKNTYRFDNEDQESDVRTLYVQQTAFPHGAPDTIKVTIEDFRDVT